MSTLKVVKVSVPSFVPGVPGGPSASCKKDAEGSAPV